MLCCTVLTIVLAITIVAIINKKGLTKNHMSASCEKSI